MDWSHLVASAAIGSLLSLLAKEAIDWLRAERAHRLDLHRRYFDAKLDATLRIIKMVKTITSTLRQTISMARDLAHGPVEESYLNQIAESHQQSVQRVRDEATGMLAVVGFYYDDELQRLVLTTNVSPTALLQKITAFVRNVQACVEARQTIDQEPPAPDDILQIAYHRLAEYDAKVQRDIADLVTMADSFDATADAIVTRMRRDFDKIRF